MTTQGRIGPKAGRRPFLFTQPVFPRFLHKLYQFLYWTSLQNDLSCCCCIVFVNICHHMREVCLIAPRWFGTEMKSLGPCQLEGHWRCIVIKNLRCIWISFIHVFVCVFFVIILLSLHMNILLCQELKTWNKKFHLELLSSRPSREI